MKIEGKNPIKEAMASNMTINKLMVQNGAAAADVKEIVSVVKQNGIKIEYVNKHILDKISETGHHQGLIAECIDFEYSDLEQVYNSAIKSNKELLFVLLDEVLDPHNLGSIIRVAECAGATAVVIPNRRSAVVNETVIRASAGATAHMPIVKVTNINQAIEWLKEKNVWVFAFDMDGEEMYKTNLTGNIGVVIGGEGTGVKALTRKLCDGVVSIPMFGKVNSLNASVSAGIALYEVVRQKSNKN